MRILLVEDEPALAETVQRGLTEERYSVDVVGNGRDAIDYALAAAYDVIILDVMLPGLDGFTVCRRLRDEGVTSHILMLTALTAVDDRVYGLDSGADDYLTKPFAFRELLARLRALARRTREIQIGPLQVADLTLDEATHEVRRGGRQIDLSPLEFRLLHCLLRHTGQVLTRDAILDQVWNFDYAGGSNVVDVYIRYLRRKIEAPNELKLLYTVRGVGYKLAETE
ncbi:MAG: DNA-binding response regulator [Anaerolineae bacterium CG2_30_64_16]|nr:MAG: DNA-binding response regulator [Anaerolineae bacterium CG2_30_64_16]